MNWLLRRLREPSTWRGLVWLATVAGLSLRPEQAEAIVAAGMALAGLLGVFLADPPPQLPPIELVSKAGAVSDPGAGAGAGAGGLRGDALPAERGRGPGAVDGDPETGWNG